MPNSTQPLPRETVFPLPTQPISLLPWEIPAYEDLEWMPLAMRYKLDSIGLKMHLKQWQALPWEERRALLAAPFASLQDQERFAALLGRKVAEACGESLSALPLSPSSPGAPTAAPNPGPPPGEFTQKLGDLGYSLAPEVWQGWSPFLRYAAIKTFTSRKPDPNLAHIAREHFAK